MTTKNKALLTTLVLLSIILTFVLALVEPKTPQEIAIDWPKPLPSIKIPILMYHYVEYNQDERDFIRDSLNVPPHVFEAQIKTLKNAGYKFITPGDLLTIMEDETLRQEKYVILSFDDGYTDFYTDVLPILKRQRVKAVNYIIYNFMGNLNYMTKDQIKTVIQSGLVEIGAHTLNHAWLKGLDKETAQNELSMSKEMLEKEFGVTITSFAYPYGAYNREVITLTKKAGYTNAVTIEPGNMVDEKNIFELPRIRPGHNIETDLLERIEKEF